MVKAILILICAMFSTIAVGQNSANRLDKEIDFKNFSGLPLVEKYGEVSAIKLVYDLETKIIYYINSKYFKYHHEFCGYKLEDDIDLKYFNEINYSDTPKRKYLLANINYYKSLGVYALEISPVDLMKKADIVSLRNIVSESTFISDSLHLLLNSARLQDLNTSLRDGIPILNPSEIYKNLSYQAISKYKNCGILRFINDLEAARDWINPMDIIVLKETPLVLPKVSGILVSEFQTPLSHLTILGQNRKIPISAYKSAFNDSTLLKQHQKKVCYTVLSDTFRIEPVNKLRVRKQNRKQVKIKFNLEVDSLVGVENLKRRSYKYAGNKANNFGILYKLSKKYDFKVPENAFVIPFYFYNQHITNSTAKELISSLLLKKATIRSRDSIKIILKEIRKAIKSTPLNSELLKSVNDRVSVNNTFTRMRFRSSTNAEDAKGFSGAGLYTSKTGILHGKKKTFERAIKKVWASLWSYQAFSEREYYNIDHKVVYMGILVHRSFPNEEVNGVAITKNLYRPSNYGFVINAQLGNESVVKPKRGVITDQFICYPNRANNIYKNKSTIDIITQSSLNGNKLVMTQTEIQHLANQLELIKKYFIRHTLTFKSYLNFGLDIEFKLEHKNRELYIKQVRLYND